MAYYANMSIQKEWIFHINTNNTTEIFIVQYYMYYVCTLPKLPKTNHYSSENKY